jgi:hypothetical protein
MKAVLVRALTNAAIGISLSRARQAKRCSSIGRERKPVDEALRPCAHYSASHVFPF